jgi:hypothetical protein
MSERFSQRHGFEATDPEITVREDAPYELRGVVVDIAYESGMTPNRIRGVVCRVLRAREDLTNWTDFPNVDQEVRNHVDSCAWNEVYDIVEAIYQSLARLDESQGWAEDGRRAERFEREINVYFHRRGVGWQLQEGLVQIRGPEFFEATVVGAREALETAGRRTAANEISQALQDLSRRPTPDLTGALQHGLAAVECVMRDASGQPRATLGQILDRNPGIVPRPLDEALERIWGFASEQGRHLREGRVPSEQEVILAVEVAAALAGYVNRRFPVDETNV